jgi:ABC-type oligopeptide transport system substrate-binding subunit
MEERKFLEPIPLGNLSPLKKNYLNEINDNFFDELNKMDLHKTPIMPSITFLESISIDKDTYMNALKVKFKKPTIFLQRSCKNI